MASQGAGAIGADPEASIEDRPLKMQSARDPAAAARAAYSAAHPCRDNRQPCGNRLGLHTRPSTLTHDTYPPVRVARSSFVPVRGLDYHVLDWVGARETPPIVMLHGWMDVAASFQFVVDALEGTALAGRRLVAPDWRGFGLTQPPHPTDSYWFPDYLGDLDGLLRALDIGGAVDLVGHSMGGNVAMSYAGVRPARVRRLVNLEGFGMPRTEPRHAPKRLAQWLDTLAEPQSLKTYADLDEVAARLRKNNPRLTADKARWLAPHWARRAGAEAGGRLHILGDPAHKRPNPVLYRVEEILETWKLITAPTLWVEAADSQPEQWWGGRYSRAEFHERLNVVAMAERHVLADCGHMLHHDQPHALATRLAAFLGAA